MTHEQAEQPAATEDELLPDSEDDFEVDDDEQQPAEPEPAATDDAVQDDGTDIELDDDTSNHSDRDTR